MNVGAAMKRFLNTNKPIMTMNGVFDILHAGHIKLLKWATEQAKEKDAQLVVLINSDASVRRLKGKKRPINDMVDRYNQLINFPGVSQVVVFTESTPVEALKTIKPKYHIFTEDHLNGPEGKLVDQGIISIALLAPKSMEIDGIKYSTSRIIERILKK